MASDGHSIREGRSAVRLLYGADDGVSDWVSNQIFGVTDFFKNCKAIGIVNDDKILAGVVYSNMMCRPDGTPYSIEASMASVDKRWAQRHTLRAIFAYPFIQLGLERLQTTTSVKSKGVIMINQKMGFSVEGIARGAYPSGGDAVVCSMLKNECRYI